MRDPVVINGRFLTQPFSGVQRYACEIVRALDRRPDAGERYLLVTPRGARALPLTSIPTRVVGRGGGHMWEQTALAWAARGQRLLSLGGAGPVFHPRQMVVVHDAAVFRRPAHFRPGYALAHRLLDRQLAGRAHLATVSRFSRQELAAVLHLDPDDIAIAPNAADHLNAVTPDAAVIGALGLTDRPYFVVLGNLAPNKNIDTVLRAMGRTPDPALRLVLVGGRPSAVANTRSAPPDPRVIQAGRRSDAEVVALLHHARGLVFASLYEGFGIPPLEALAQGCPVIASDIDATREVCGDAALYFAPTDDAALAHHMQTLMAGSDPARRAAGLHRANAYDWAASATVLDDWLSTTWR